MPKQQNKYDRVINRITTGSDLVRDTNLDECRSVITEAMEAYARPYKELLREIIMRKGLAFPQTAQDEDWFNNWFDNADIVQRITNFVVRDTVY